jgi:hypothetical protein
MQKLIDFVISRIFVENIHLLLLFNIQTLITNENGLLLN